MKKLLTLLMCALAFEMQAIEYEKQFENDQVCVGKAIIAGHEEIGLHRDTYPQVVIALRGGTITRLEANGEKTDVHFPTGKAVFREADPENELHRSVNNSAEAVEMIIIQLKNSPCASPKDDSQSQDILISIKINAPMSDELRDFVKSIPPSGNYASSFEEWKSSFTNNMNQLVRLVESGKVSHSFWSVKVDERLLQDLKGN